MELAVSIGFSGTAGTIGDGFELGDRSCVELARREGGRPGPTPFEERREFVEAFRSKVGVPGPDSRPREGLGEGNLGLGEWGLRPTDDLKGVAGPERRDGLRPGDVEMVSCFSDRVKSLLSSLLFTTLVGECRRNGSCALGWDAIAQCETSSDK